MTRTPSDLLEFTCSALERVRADAPLVQCITNTVAANVTANVLLALGASPAMADVPGEAGPFARVASGLLINLGTPAAEQRKAILEAASAANDAGTPWVLDPVAVGALPVRTTLAEQLRELRPTVVRGNASEILALAGTGAGGRGVDSSDGVDDAMPAARSLAERAASVVAVSGQVDAITDGREVVRIANGNPLLTKITGGGCALGAVMAAFAAVDDDQMATTAAAVTVYTIAAELAAERAAGPGSFQVAFLDALAGIDADDIGGRAVLS